MTHAEKLLAKYSEQRTEIDTELKRLVKEMNQSKAESDDGVSVSTEVMSNFLTKQGERNKVLEFIKDLKVLTNQK